MERSGRRVVRQQPPPLADVDDTDEGDEQMSERAERHAGTGAEKDEASKSAESGKGPAVVEGTPRISRDYIDYID